MRASKYYMKTNFLANKSLEKKKIVWKIN